MTAKAHVRWLLTVFLLVALLNDHGEATSIVAVRTPDSITVGVDSAEITVRSNHRSSKLVCKIHQDGNMFFAFAGLANHVRTSFDTAEIIVRASKPGGTISDRAKRLASELVRLAPKEVATLRTNNPNRYHALIEGDTDFVEVLFFGIENGVPVVTTVAVDIALSADGRITATPRLSFCPGSDCPNGVLALFLGRHEAIDRYVAGLKERTTPPDPSAMINFLIGLEVADQPKDVQPPINIIRIDPNGTKWTPPHRADVLTHL
jgi:hypothetical protein